MNSTFNIQHSTLLLTSGTRGDIQPMLALALELGQSGQSVGIVSQAAFGAMVAERGLPFAALAASPSEAFEIVGQDALVLGRNPLRSLLASVRYMHIARPLFSAMLTSAWQHCRQAKHLILTLPSMAWGLSIAEASGCRCTLALLQPLGPTRAFPSPLLPFARNLGPVNRASHTLSAQLLWRPWLTQINQWRRSMLGLPALPASGPALFNNPALPLHYYHSPQLLPKPADWPEHAHVCGFRYLDAPPGWQPPAEIVRFLERGPAPVYVGFGSMGQRRPDLPELVVRALRSLGLRGLLALDAPLAPELAGADMQHCGPVWHDWLFPQLRAAIHHGGAGTTAAALRAGIPSIIAPIAVDQFFWARRIHELGLGYSPGPLRNLSQPKLEHALSHCVS